jgi:virginiamycin B lyase
LKISLARLAGTLTVALALAGCGATTPITSGTPTPAPPYVPNVSAEYPVASGGPSGIVASSSGLWFTEPAADKIGELTTSATVLEFPVPTPGAKPLSITYTVSGDIWFTENGAAKIARYTAGGGGFTECQLPMKNGLTPTPWGITAANDGTLWVTDPGTNGIWNVTTGCVDAWYPLPTANALPESITTGPDGALWFVETNANQIGRITSAGTINEYKVSAGAGLGTIVAGSDNALWFTETTADKLGRMLTSGALTNETPLTGMKAPYGLVLGIDGNFYIGDQSGSAIAQYQTATGAINVYPTKTTNAGVGQLTLGPGADHEVYFTESTANNIGQFRYY